MFIFFSQPVETLD